MYFFHTALVIVDTVLVRRAIVFLSSVLRAGGSIVSYFLFISVSTSR